MHVEVSDSEPHRIESVVWDGQGCSISQASLSIMVNLVEGKTVDEAMELFGQFHKLMESRGAGLDDEQAEAVSYTHLARSSSTTTAPRSK